MNVIDRGKLEACEGWEDWMDNWIVPIESPCEMLTIYVCYHPDECPFYASSVPQEAVNAFYKPEFKYD